MAHKKIILGFIVLLGAAIVLFLLKTPSIEGDDTGGKTLSEKFLGPGPYPAAQQSEGMRQPHRLPLCSLFAYKALPEYAQSPTLDSLVRAGVLPPVEERLPENPCVALKGSMNDGMGVYGGVWRGMWCSPLDGWNWGAGQGQGWWGINDFVQQPLLRAGPVFLRSDSALPIPNLATDWQWSKDGKTLTMHLMKGARWSDGHPFTSDDVMFTWNDIILDSHVISYTNRTTWQIGGKDISLVALDKSTIKWTFPEPFPYYVLFRMCELGFPPSPFHVLKKYHPRYNKKMDYNGFGECLKADSLPPVTMGAWVPVLYRTDNLLVMRRNPYYWKVDELGHQLPYLDEVVFKHGSNGNARTVAAFAGDIDHSNLDETSMFIEATKREKDRNAPFRIEWGPEVLGYNILFNLSTSVGVKTVRDSVIHGLMRDLRFRRAIAQSIDREGLCQALSRGPFLRPWPGGLTPGCDFFDPASVVDYPYSPATAQSLFKELGLEDTDGDGTLNFTSGPLQGKNISLLIYTNTEASTQVEIAEALIPLLGAVGIKALFRPINATMWQDVIFNGRYDMFVQRTDPQFISPIQFGQILAPIRNDYPIWHRVSGSIPRVLLPFEKDIVRVVDSFISEADMERKRELLSEFNHIATENLYTVGLVAGRYGILVAKKFRNIPTGTPVVMYGWAESNMMPEQVWIPKDLQSRVPDMLPGVVPRYRK